MARPRLDPAQRRTETLAIRLTEAERLQVEQAAIKAGLTASEFARTQVLGGRVIIRQNRTLDHTVFDELRRIGVNLNQLTRLAHQRGQLPAGLEEVCATLERILVRELDGDSAPAGEDGPNSRANWGYGRITVRFGPSLGSSDRKAP